MATFPQLGAPPDVLAPFISYIGYHNLLNSEIAADPSLVTSGDAPLALDHRPYTKWNPTNSGDKTFEVQLAYDQENWLLQSGDLSNAEWTKVNATAGASTIIEDSTAAVEHYIHQSVPKAAVAEAWTLTAFIDGAGRTFAGIRLDDGAGNGYRLDINLTTGALGTPVALGTGFALLGSSATEVGGGFWRVRLSVTSNAATTIRALIQPESALGTVSFNGNGTTSLNVTGAQMVKGSLAKPASNTTTERRIPPADQMNPVDDPEFYTADYAAVYAYALRGGTLYLDYFDRDTLAYVNFLTFTPSELDGSPVMKMAGTAKASHAWRVRITGVPENLLTFSEQANNAAWVKTDTTVTTDNLAAPDGTTSAELLTEGTAGTANVYQENTVLNSNLTKTFSVYLKRGNHDWAQVLMSNAGNTNAVRAWFNLATGTVGTGNAVGTGVYVAHAIESVGNGWYRCAITGNPDPATGTIRCRTQSASADAAVQINSGTRYQWGGQYEPAATGPTAYTVTTTAPVALDALLGVVNIGQWLGLPMQQIGWTPARMARRTQLKTNTSDSGQYLGRSLIRNAWEFEITGRFLDLEWAYDAWEPFVQHAEQFPFFFRWAVPGTTVDDTAFCWVDSGEIERPSASAPFRVDVSLPVSAIVGTA